MSLRARILDSPGGLRDIAAGLESGGEGEVQPSEHHEGIRKQMVEMKESLRTCASTSFDELADRFKKDFGEREQVAFVKSEPAFFDRELIRLLLFRLKSSKSQALRTLSVIWILSRVANNKIIIASEHGIELIVRILAENLRDAQICICGIAVLINVAANGEQCMQLIANEDGVSTIVSAMRMHKGNAEMQEQGCRAIGNIAISKETKNLIVNEGAVSVIVEALRRHSDVESVATQCCFALRQIAQNEAVVVELLSRGGVGEVLAAMKIFEQSAALQQQAMVLLDQILAPETVVGENVKIMLAAQGGVKVIVSTVENHIQNYAVVRTGVDLLSHFATSKLRRSEHGSAFILPVLFAGGVEILVKIFRQYIADEVLTMESCTALVKYIVNPAARSRIISLGGDELSGLMLSNHKSHGVMHHASVLRSTLNRYLTTYS